MTTVSHGRTEGFDDYVRIGRVLAWMCYARLNRKG